MYKVTKDGIKRIGKENKITQEDRDFIGGLFEDFSNYENPFDYKRDTEEDDLYDDLVHK